MKNFIQVTTKAGSMVLLNVNQISVIHFPANCLDYRAEIVMVGGLTYQVLESREHIQGMVETAMKDFE